MSGKRGAITGVFDRGEGAVTEKRAPENQQNYAHQQKAQQTCVYCDKSDKGGENLKTCGKCQTTLYCSHKCQKEHYKCHKSVCKAIHSVNTHFSDKNKQTVESIKGQIYELSHKTKSKICKLIGDKCLVKVVMNQREEQVLWDTGAQVSLVVESWVRSNDFEQHVRPLNELFDLSNQIRQWGRVFTCGLD